MRYLKLTFITAACCIVAACSTSPVLNERNIRIRYVNMAVVFQYMVKNDAVATSLEKQLNQQRSRVNTLEKEYQSAGDAGMKRMLSKDLENAKNELERLQRQEELFKQKTYEEIRRALTDIAKRSNIDYILNVGDGLVYADRNNDITETLLREIAARRKRNAPVSQ